MTALALTPRTARTAAEHRPRWHDASDQSWLTECIHEAGQFEAVGEHDCAEATRELAFVRPRKCQCSGPHTAA